MTPDERRLALDTLLAEYTTLRQEILQAMHDRLTAMSLTLGAISVLVTALLTQRVTPIVRGLIGLLIIPQVAKAGLMIWLGEYRRSQRAASWISQQLEERINAVAGSEDALSWEGRHEHMRFPYLATVFLVLGVSYGSIIVGWFLLNEGVTQQAGYSIGPIWSRIAGAVGFSLVTEGLFAWLFRKNWKVTRADYRRPVSPSAALATTTDNRT